jgi:hypothetical protein
MAAGPWQLYNDFLYRKSTGIINMATDTFKVALLSSDYTFDASDSGWADVSGDEIAAGNGYTAGGLELEHTFTQAGAGTVFDAANPLWIASGAGITARYAVVYDDTPTDPAKPLVACCQLDTADIIKAAGQPLEIVLSASGFLSEAPAI